MRSIRKERNSDIVTERLLSKDYILLMIVALGQASMNSFFLAAKPLFIVRLGGSTLQAGIVTTAYVLTAVAIRPVAGMLSDKSGRIKFVIAGALICAVTCALFGIIGIIPILIFIRAVNGVGFGVLSTCTGAAVADVLPKKRLAEGIGYFGLSSTLAQAVGPGIALAIVAGDAISDYRTLFFLTSGICLVSAACGCCVTYERKRKKTACLDNTHETTSDKEASGTADDIALPKTLFGFEYAIFAPIFVMILIYIGLGGGLMSFLTPFARWRGIENSGLYFAVNAVGMFISRFVFGKVADKRGSDILIIPGMVVIVVCLALFPTIKSMTGLVAFSLPLGLAQGVVMPTFNSMLFRRCSPARRGTASGAFYVGIDTGFAIGAPLLGVMADVRDYRYIFWVGAISVFLALMLYLLVASDKRFNAAGSDSVSAT